MDRGGQLSLSYSHSFKGRENFRKDLPMERSRLLEVSVANRSTLFYFSSVQLYIGETSHGNKYDCFKPTSDIDQAHS